MVVVDCGSDVAFDGKEHVTVSDSSDEGQRGFCSCCGSHLFYRLKAADDYLMAAGLFDDKRWFIFDHQVFIEGKPDYYRFANEMRQMTGAEIFAQFECKA